MKNLLLLLAVLGVTFIRAQVITVTSPNGGEVWNTGTNQSIKWTSQAVTDVNIDYSTDGGNSWSNIVTSQDATTGSYTWNVGGPASLSCYVRISSSSNSSIQDQSNASFIIGPVAYLTAGFVNPDSTHLQKGIICAGSGVQLLATGGVITNPGGGPPPPPPGLTYTWSPSTGLSNANISNPVATPTVTTIYTVTGDDGDGQTAVGTDTVVVLTSPQITVAAAHDTANYLHPDTLTATLTSGGPATYEWLLNGSASHDTGATTGSQSYIIANTPGMYECIAANSNGCTDTSVIYIQAGLTVSISSQTNNSCSYTSTGAIDVTVTGGTGNYTYNWSNNSTSQNLTGLPAGTYSLTVYDNLGNVGTVTTTITAPTSIQVTIYNSLVSGFPDTLSVSVSGGTPPYAYNWSNNVTTATDIVSVSDIYACTVTDMSQCYNYALTTVGIIAANDTFRVPGNTTSQLNVLRKDVWQSGYFFGPSITGVTTPAHGTTAYSSGGVSYTPSNNYLGADSFTYTVCLGDSFNNVYSLTSICDTATVYLTVVDSVVISVHVQPTTCGSTCNGSISLQVSGGMPPYTFNWADSSGLHTDTTQNLMNLCKGASYSVTVTDAAQDSATATAVVYSNAPYLTMYAYVDTIVAYVNNGSDAYRFAWSTGFADTSYYSSAIAVSQSGFYCVTATDTTGNGCVITDCDSIGCIGCVWPGDANDDGIANNNDLLPIGLAYGATGTVRPGANNSWSGQPCAAWTDTLLTGTNYKFIDCNGDGTIDANDTLPIVLNFGRTHLKNGELRDWRSLQPGLYVNLSPDTLTNGETVTATFSLGSPAIPADNVYGLSFTYNYDPKVVDSTKTQMTFGDSWIGNSTNKISLAKNFGEVGQLECAITRIDHTTVNGNGAIGMATFVITTDNINGLNLADYNWQTWISNLKVIDNLGNEMQFNEGGDTSVVQYTAAAVSEVNADASINIFPNPVHDQLIIQSKNQLAMQQITLIDLLGNAIITQTVTQPYQTTVSVSSLSSGVYFVEIKTATATVMKRFVVAR